MPAKSSDGGMTTTEALQKLESLGKETTRKTYLRHGVKEPMFGVNYGDLEKLRKSIKVDQALAQNLWKSGNHDARILAAMVADANSITIKDLTNWATSATNPLQSHGIAQLAAKSPVGKDTAIDWIESKHELTASAGWTLISLLANNHETIEDKYFLPLLKRIESNIHKSPNEVRATMNGALIAIGRRNAALQKPALEAAKRIGPVDVDHGDTACKTPDATEYILKKNPRK
jgi:3-methyladenine DNA glycosylase AlkD